MLTSPIIIARPGVGGDIGKEREGGKEQEEHSRRVKERQEAGLRSEYALYVTSKAYATSHATAFSENHSKRIIPPSQRAMGPKGIYYDSNSLCQIAAVANASVNAQIFRSAIHVPSIRCSPHQQLFLSPCWSYSSASSQAEQHCG